MLFEREFLICSLRYFRWYSVRTVPEVPLLNCFIYRVSSSLSSNAGTRGVTAFEVNVVTLPVMNT